MSWLDWVVTVVAAALAGVLAGALELVLLRTREAPMIRTHRGDAPPAVERLASAGKRLRALMPELRNILIEIADVLETAKLDDDTRNRAENVHGVLRDLLIAYEPVAATGEP